MQTIDERFMKLGLRPADILLPVKSVDLSRWAVVACDQFTSEPEYWKRVEEYVGQAPSTLHLIYPEVYLEEPDKEERIKRIDQTMRQYLDQQLFATYPHSFLLVHRTTAIGHSRWGLMAALDLDQYDYSKESTSLIRATEGTILSRIPPRKEIRKNAVLEIPHIMVLIDDAERQIIEALAAKRDQLTKVYETELMAGGGSIEGLLVDKAEDLELVAKGFEKLYEALDPKNPLLFAMGDGNHSLATAKSCWEDRKTTLSEAQRANDPGRFCLVELENIHDDGLTFEPIHRVLFHVDFDTFCETVENFASGGKVVGEPDFETLCAAVNDPAVKGQKFGYVDSEGPKLFILEDPVCAIAAGTLQKVIDILTSEGKTTVDYVHGTAIVQKLSKEAGNAGLVLPDIAKQTFFDTIRHDKAFPRKTFSMGEATEKRYYLEARKISN